MRGFVRAVLAGGMVVLAATAAWGQEDLEQGKNGAQLFATDCAICHKSAQALVKNGYPTEGFLRVHYTSSREMAVAVYGYLRGIARPAAAKAPDKKVKRRAKADETEAKPAAKKASGVKAGEAKTPEKKDRP